MDLLTSLSFKKAALILSTSSPEALSVGQRATERKEIWRAALLIAGALQMVEELRVIFKGGPPEQSLETGIHAAVVMPTSI